MAVPPAAVPFAEVLVAGVAGAVPAGVLARGVPAGVLPFAGVAVSEVMVPVGAVLAGAVPLVAGSGVATGSGAAAGLAVVAAGLAAAVARARAVRLVAGFGAARDAVTRVPAARVPVLREVLRCAAVGWSAGCSGAGDAAVEELAGVSTGDRPLPVTAERGAGVLLRLLVRDARLPFCPSTATTTLLPNAAGSEAPTKMGER
ncbi:MAG TPA: hypothetical protein VH008_14570 [Pseudonocardia sp.]|nr:hypothetical protein [Pseudonocardia sp.]